MSEIEEAVRAHYAEAARGLAAGQSCCSPDGECGCCGDYDAQEIRLLGIDAGASLGCGNPTLLARLEPGQVVLDLGSGAGLDVLLSARRVAPDGHAYGVDMTDEMLDIANRNRELAGVPNATLLKGKIDAVPLPDASVDVVISNCVINLAEDKSAVVAEAFRLLKPGGLLAVADMVEVQRLSPELKRRLDSWAGCISGTIAVDEYRSILVGAGFEEPEIEVHSQQTMTGGGTIGSAYIRARKSH
jgi:ubiquinone/menaquinone biosynthesis C-methylase UbiE